jgi:penicillin-binding protein
MVGTLSSGGTPLYQRYKHWIKYIGIAAILGILFIGGIVFGYASSLVQDERVRSQEEILNTVAQSSTTGFVYFNDGTPIGQLRGIDRQVVDLADIPTFIRKSFLSIEDNNFYHHHGVDLGATVRAFKQKLFNEDVQTGGSTITQQVARNYFLNLDVTTSRKVKEIFLALRLERFLTKDQILQAYLNRVPFGNGSTGYNVYGIKSAAIGIFNQPNLNKLNVAQAAYLAGLPQSPSAYSAFDGTGAFNPYGFDRAIKRQKLVLKRMLQEKTITKKQYKEALAFDVRKSLAKPGSKAYSTYPYLMVEVERRAAEQLILTQHPELTEADLRKPENQTMIEDAIGSMLEKGYKIYTTINQGIYDHMQTVASNPNNFTPEANGDGFTEQIGAVMVNNKTGAILGMIEGRDFNKSQFNHATQAERQPGSTMKPIAAYLPALESGAIQPGSILDDSPMILADGAKGSHIPNNWNSQFQGLITARVALNQSYNIPALYLFNRVVGIQNAWAFAKKLGITTLTEADDTAATGVIGGLTNGVTVEEMTNAYASIPNQGIFTDAFLIDKIVDAKGDVVYQHHVKKVKVYEPQTAYLMTDMLKSVVTDGTAKTLKNRFKYLDKIQVAGKTGSTQKDRDAWFVGFTPDVTLGIWAGYDKDNTLTTHSRLPQGPGTQRAKNIWALIMNHTLEKEKDVVPTRAFAQPEKIKAMTVSNFSGLLPSSAVSGKGMVHTDLFNTKYLPTTEDTSYGPGAYIKIGNLNYIPSESMPKDFVKSAMLVKRPINLSAIMKRIGMLLKTYTPETRPMKTKTQPMTIKDYLPKDYFRTYPTEVDPRTDDGANPDAPTGMQVKKVTATRVQITFTKSAARDVVGYRIYKSGDGKTFTYDRKENVWQTDAGVKEIGIAHGPNPTYKVVAVDIAGNESK